MKVKCVMNVGERVVVTEGEKEREREKINDVKPILIPSLKPTRVFFRVCTKAKVSTRKAERLGLKLGIRVG